jgi:hypothetical protein
MSEKSAIKTGTGKPGKSLGSIDKDGIGKPPYVPGWDPDAKLLAARGVSSYEELNAKYKDGERIA